jgi:hypothetical protein
VIRLLLAAGAVVVVADRIVRHREGAGLLAKAGRRTTVLTVRKPA